MILFGPVPSRRLGRSLGINNLPLKACSFSCLYCQAGKTTKLQVDRTAFYSPEKVAAATGEKVRALREAGETVDYLSFVPNGEPTLDVNLGRIIDLLKPLGIRIAVITNASLLWRKDVRAELSRADWVSVKVDSVREDVWRKLKQPHGDLLLDHVLAGITAFAREYRGELVSETMLVRALNDSEQDVELTARFLSELKPSRSFLSLPLRPPADGRVEPPEEDVANRSFRIFGNRGLPVELLAEYEDSSFSPVGNIAENLLSITAVHPMREEAVRAVLAKSGANWSTVTQLIDSGRLVRTIYEGEIFYIKRFSGRDKEQT
jgi:wyosine [tRNA(Phe)-imidazoG37] synthetase (radical SAM superfamily)